MFAAARVGPAKIGRQGIGQFHLEAVAGVGPQDERFNRRTRFEADGLADSVVDQIIRTHIQQRSGIVKRTGPLDAAQRVKHTHGPVVVNQPVRPQHINGPDRRDLKSLHRRGVNRLFDRAGLVKVPLIGNLFHCFGGKVIIRQHQQVFLRFAVGAEDAPHAIPEIFGLSANRVQIVKVFGETGGSNIRRHRHIKIGVLGDAYSHRVRVAGVRRVWLAQPLHAVEGEGVLFLVRPNLKADAHFIAHISPQDGGGRVAGVDIARQFRVGYLALHGVQLGNGPGGDGLEGQGQVAGRASRLAAGVVVDPQGNRFVTVIDYIRPWIVGRDGFRAGAGAAAGTGVREPGQVRLVAGGGRLAEGGVDGVGKVGAVLAAAGLIGVLEVGKFQVKLTVAAARIGGQDVGPPGGGAAITPGTHRHAGFRVAPFGAFRFNQHGRVEANLLVGGGAVVIVGKDGAHAAVPGAGQ